MPDFYRPTGEKDLVDLSLESPRKRRRHRREGLDTKSCSHGMCVHQMSLWNVARRARLCSG